MMNQPRYHSFIDSPIGWLRLSATDDALVAVNFNGDKQNTDSESSENAVLQKAKNQLHEYFDGSRKTFSVPLEPSGTDFEKEVWQQLNNIMYGSTITYSQIANQLGNINKVRAVGRANGQNPVPIVIPCHRVIGTDDKLTGYAGGIERKRWLLQHEGILLL